MWRIILMLLVLFGGDALFDAYGPDQGTEIIITVFFVLAALFVVAMIIAGFQIRKENLKAKPDSWPC